MVKLSVSTAALLALSIAVSVSSQPQSSTQSLLQHRHSFVSTQSIEPSDDNIKVTRHQVQIVGLSGFHEWEVKGSLEGLSKASGKSLDRAGESPNNNGRVHVQWFSTNSPLLRPPFTPTFIPGFHLAITSNDFTGTWKEYCPVLAEFIGAVDCQDYAEDQPLEPQGTSKIKAKHLISVHEHHYVHRNVEPSGFMTASSVVASLISKQQSGLSTAPALIDLVLQNGNAALKVIWPVGNNGQNDNENVVTVSFDEQRDKVIEVGWFYRELTEQDHTVQDHYLGATVKLDAKGEVFSEALIQARSPVFPPHKLDAKSGEIRIPGHGYSSIMSPSQTFHPHSITTIKSNPYIAETTADCDLHVLQVLPAGIFVDPFQLQNLAPEIGEALVFGETDLEKPVGVVPGWGSLVMIKVPSEDSGMTSRWIAGNSTEASAGSADTKSSYTSTIDIPMHMRYQPPVPVEDPATHIDVAIPWPIVAWTCPTIGASGEESSNAAAKKLFHIPVLPLSLLFPKEGDKGAVNFRFLLPDPIPKRFPESQVFVPVGRLQDLALVRTSTFAMAVVGTFAVAFALIKSVSSRSSGKGKQD
ncbi:PIG-X [Mortierella sp. GBAus27b]|nr:protease B nonderepressible form [Mortierella sp. GBA43]KAI8354495.1 PIG-X [Mortierella sp. GBAus27b]